MNKKFVYNTFEDVWDPKDINNYSKTVNSIDMSLWDTKWSNTTKRIEEYSNSVSFMWLYHFPYDSSHGPLLKCIGTNFNFREVRHRSKLKFCYKDYLSIWNEFSNILINPLDGRNTKKPKLLIFL